MKQTSWVGLSANEKALLLRALTQVSTIDTRRSERLRALAKKLSAETYPKITVGVYGGLVQWTAGNPFPVRIIDYDGEKPDLRDRDEEGQLCTIWYKPADRSTRAS